MGSEGIPRGFTGLTPSGYSTQNSHRLLRVSSPATATRLRGFYAGLGSLSPPPCVLSSFGDKLLGRTDAGLLQCSLRSSSHGNDRSFCSQPGELRALLSEVPKHVPKYIDSPQTHSCLWRTFAYCFTTADFPQRADIRYG